MRSSDAVVLARQMGLPWFIDRAGYALKHRIGWFAWRTPVRPWSHWRIDRVSSCGNGDELAALMREPSTNPFRVAWTGRDTARVADMAPDSAQDGVDRVDQVRNGHMRLFEACDVEVGWPPAWMRHPDTGETWPSQHWSRLPDMGSSDVKVLWEIARFDVAYAAARAYAYTGDDGHAETFWQLVESWRDANPPNAGPQWMCGQECSIRAIAWCFAMTVLLDAPSTTPTRVGRLVEMLAAHAERIEANIDFAVSQRNNHGINEALGLFTIGTMLPWLRRAAHWADLGRRTLEIEVSRQIGPDGAYVQHSLNYHRLVVQSLSWAAGVAEVAASPLGDEAMSRFRSSVELLAQLVDASGQAPNYGSNDGSQLLHLDACEFEDYRPTIALGYWAAAHRRVYTDGPWSEPLWWLYGDEPFVSPVEPIQRESVATAPSGYVTLDGSDTWAFTRCCTYECRPAQADMLHVDIWWRGHNVVADAGTYSYNAAAPWRNGLAHTRVHNTIEVDGLDQMRRGPRFTWFDWTESQIIRHESGDSFKIFEGEHNGYSVRLGIVHRRTLILAGDTAWIVIDDILGSGMHDLASQWLIPAGSVISREPSHVVISTPAGTIAMDASAQDMAVELVEPADADALGWLSTRYRHRKPALSLVTRSRCDLPFRRIVVFGLTAELSVTLAGAHLAVWTDRGAAEIGLQPVSQSTLGSIVQSTRLLTPSSR